MKTNYLKYFISITSILLITCTLSCSGRSGKRSATETNPVEVLSSEAPAQLIKLISPEENTGFKVHDQVKLILALVNMSEQPDSVSIIFNGLEVKTLKTDPWDFSIPSSFTKTTGRKSLRVTAYKKGKAEVPITRFLIFYSDISPKKYGYRIIHSYSHDREAFTQGLVYDKGVLLEGTGQIGSSNIREVELETGKVVRQHNLDRSLFGEGIALYKDRIYQVTWQNKVGFVYNRSTFNQINKISYSTEGWGLTTIDNKIVLSDGTNILYFYDPEMFTVVSKIEVYDNEKKVDLLNELEYINGEIWANIWMTDMIARIDPISGKVLAYIDLKGILPNSERYTDTDVLNGIAYDKAGDRIFITGKKWPKLFEIKLTE